MKGQVAASASVVGSEAACITKPAVIDNDISSLLRNDLTHHGHEGLVFLEYGSERRADAHSRVLHTKEE